MTGEGRILGTLNYMSPERGARELWIVAAGGGERATAIFPRRI